MKIRLAKLVDISNISTLYRTLFQTMAELQIEYYRKADQDVDFLKSVINSDTKDILVAEEDEQIIGFVLVQQLDTPPYACIVPHRYTLLMDIVVSDLYRGQGMAKSVIIPYFKERKITLSEIKATDIQAFYMKQLKRVKANTVIHYHSVIHRALKYAVKIDLISVNPADKVERPKADKFIGSFYDSNEVQALFEAAKGTLIEIPIFLGAFYGLRRSEALGLKWDAIDFQNNTITIRHTVTSCNLDGKHIQIAQDTTKTKSSMRTLPLVPAFKEKLLKLKEQQEEYRRVCGRCYNKKYLEYICVDEMGTLISPHYLTASFPKLLEKNNLRHIRFHDLRHSCASLLLANGVPMKQIQEWLGHSDFSTTANVYAHLDYNSKLSSADAMVNGLSGALEVIS